MKLFKSTLLAAVALVGFAFTACDEDNEYTPAEQSSGVYFHAIEGYALDLAKDATSFNVYVGRAGDKAAATYDITAEYDADLFTVPTSVTFAENADSAAIEIAYDPAKLGTGNEQEISLKFADEALQIHGYGKSEITFDVVIPIVWGPWKKLLEGTSTFITSGIIAGSEGDKIAGLATDYRVDEELETRWQIRISKVGKDEEDEDLDLIIDYDAATGECLVKTQQVGYWAEYGFPLYATDIYTALVNSPELAASLGVTSDMFAGASVFSIETGLIEVFLAYTISTDISNDNFYRGLYETFQVDGIKDYSVSISFDGVLTSENKKTDSAVFSVSVGPDATEARVAMATMDVDYDEFIEAIIEGSINYESVAPGDGQRVILRLEEEGEYMAVAVVFDGKEYITEDADTFTYSKAAGEDPGTGNTSEWVDAGAAIIADGWILSAYDWRNQDGSSASYANELLYQTSVEKDLNNPGVYRIVDMFTDPYGPHIGLGVLTVVESTDIIVDARDPQCVKIMPQSTGANWADFGGEAYISNIGGLWAWQGATNEEIIAAEGNDVNDDGYVIIQLPLVSINPANIEDWTYWADANDNPTPALVYIQDLDPDGNPETVAPKKIDRTKISKVSSELAKGNTNVPSFKHSKKVNNVSSFGRTVDMPRYRR